jgi:hypothetical protein
MATDEYGLTSRFKIPVPTKGNTNWQEFLTHWAEVNDVMFTVLSNKDYVISGLVVSSDPASLNFSYTAGSVSINSATVDIVSGNGSLQADAFNWIYVQNAVLKISNYPPTGTTYVPIACLQTSTTGVVGPADLRPSPPTVNDITINPYQVNPTDNINLAVGKRIVHADSNVGSNIVMFGNAQTQTIMNWGNQAAAKDWTEYSVGSLVAATTKFIVLNCYMATYNADSNGWAVLEVKTSDDHDDNNYNFVDYGHPGASVLNSPQRGHANQITLPITSDKKFRVRTLVDSLGVTGVYYASIKILGYIT